MDKKKSELASQRIAFEEEKLDRLDSDGPAPDSEAEALRLKLKEQVCMLALCMLAICMLALCILALCILRVATVV